MRARLFPWQASFFCAVSSSVSPMEWNKIDVCPQGENFRLVTCTNSLSMSYLSSSSGLQLSQQYILQRYSRLAEQHIGTRRQGRVGPGDKRRLIAANFFKALRVTWPPRFCLLVLERLAEEDLTWWKRDNVHSAKGTGLWKDRFVSDCDGDLLSLLARRHPIYPTERIHVSSSWVPSSRHVPDTDCCSDSCLHRLGYIALVP